MAKVDDMLADGIVEAIPGDDNKVCFNVPLLIPKAVINQNGFELFAKTFGWVETVKDENGDDIPNPITAYQKGISVIRNFAWEILEAQMVEAAREQATNTVKAQVAGLRGV
jgi:hypothetical protein